MRSLFFCTFLSYSAAKIVKKTGNLQKMEMIYAILGSDRTKGGVERLKSIWTVT